ncbi:unnamed protein product [Paramecium primaurelia]|uniref:V-SNARE coiled-coil homology domain-containing protein n=1 Tax=Paramecium primaurelia TaxID=5886 RepID=A0A8S1NBS5_PARPR|nr:unnamed protein product [Paramecium primaurelia]
MAYALAKWQTSSTIGVISLVPNDNQVVFDLQNALQFLKNENISQFQKIKYITTQGGKWYYLPFNKEVVQLVLTANDYNQENVEMLINSINAKIFDHNPITPQNITIQQKQNIYNLLIYFDQAHGKEPKQIQQILQTLDNTKQTVQQNIEKLINNKEQLLNIEVQSLELDNSSQVFLNSAQELHRKQRMQKLKTRLIIGSIIIVGLAISLYVIFG